MTPMPHSPAGLPGLLLAAALALPAAAAPDPVLVPPLPTLAPVEPRDLAQDLAPLQGATAPAAPVAEPAPTPPPVVDGVMIQTASFRVPGNARAAAEALDRAGLPAVVEGPLSGGLHRVLVGPVPPEALRETLSALARAGYGDAFALTKPPRRALSR